MVRFIINVVLTKMIVLILIIAPDFKSCVILGIVMLAAFIGINVVFDKDEVKTIR